jgi:integrase
MTKRYALNDKIITGSKAKKAPKLTYTLTDGQNLYIEANHASAKPYQWRFQFVSPVTGKRNRLSFGDYPTVGIAQARERAQEARKDIAQGIDPAQARESARAVLQLAQAAANDDAERAAKGLAKRGSFREAAEAFLELRRAKWSDSYANEYELSMANHVYPHIGDMLMGDVRPKHIAPIEDKHVKAGTLEAMRKALRWTSAVFMRGIKLGTCEMNPVVVSREVYEDHARTHRPAATQPDDIRTLVHAIWNRGEASTTRALKLMAWTMQRVTTVCEMQWAHIDLEAGMWTVPAALMKGRKVLKMRADAKSHIVPLPRQAVALLRTIKAEQERRDRSSPFVLHARSDTSKGMNRSSPTEALHLMGFKGDHCSHGFRAMGRTAGARQVALDGKLLERQLAHKTRVEDDGGLGEAYIRDDEFYRLPEQVKARADAVQAWADYLDSLRKPQLALAA